MNFLKLAQNIALSYHRQLSLLLPSDDVAYLLRGLSIGVCFQQRCLLALILFVLESSLDKANLFFVEEWWKLF